GLGAARWSDDLERRHMPGGVVAFAARAMEDRDARASVALVDDDLVGARVRRAESLQVRLAAAPRAMDRPGAGRIDRHAAVGEHADHETGPAAGFHEYVNDRWHIQAPLGIDGVGIACERRSGRLNGAREPPVGLPIGCLSFPQWCLTSVRAEVRQRRMITQRRRFAPPAALLASHCLAASRAGITVKPS